MTSVEESIELDRGGLTTPPLDVVINIIVRYAYYFCIIPIIVGVCVYFGVEAFIQTTYTAKTVFLPPQQPQVGATAALQSLTQLAGVSGGLKTPADQYVSLMQSNNVLNGVIKTENLTDWYACKTMTEARRVLLSNLSVGVGKKDGLVYVEVIDKNSQKAADIANEHVAQLRRITTELALSEAQQRKVFYEAQLRKASMALAIAQKELQASGVGMATIKAEPKAAADAFSALRAQVTATEVRIAGMRTYLTNSSPALRHEVSELNALLGKLKEIEGTNDASGDSVAYIEKYRDYKYYENLYEMLARQYEAAKIDEARDNSLIQVVDVATPPEEKTGPKPLRIAAIAALGSIILLLLCLVVKAELTRTGGVLRHR